MDSESTSYGFLGDLSGGSWADGLDVDPLMPDMTDGDPGAFDGMAYLRSSFEIAASGASADRLAALLDLDESPYLHGVDDCAAATEHSCSSDQVSFCGKYTDAEIDKLQRDVRDCGEVVSHLRSDIHHQENMVSLSDTQHGRESGDYNSEVDRLKELTSDMNRAIDELRDAQTRLRNVD